jgi:sulfate permease, SulP family
LIARTGLPEPFFQLSAKVDLVSHLFSRALVALSLCESDHELLQYAARLAQLGIVTEFHLAHVLAPGHRDGMAAARQQGEEALLEHAVQFRAELPEGSTVTTTVLEGVRIDSLIELVGEKRLDLIVMGHRKRRSGLRSLAQRLAMIAPASIWMIPEGAPRQMAKVLAPVDFSEYSADSLSVAMAIAERRGLTECLSLHVYFDPSTIRYYENIRAVRGNEQKEFADFLKPIEQHGVTLQPMFEESSKVADTILRTMEQQGVELVVMSTRGRSRAASILLGSTTSQVMVACRVPILVVKHFGARLNLLQVLRSDEVWERRNPKAN